uniref:Zinc finger protein 692-like n=1 Tax=Salmo trutta TaxID=8032 RepID=A0A674CYC4_SALTR
MECNDHDDDKEPDNPDNIIGEKDVPSPGRPEPADNVSQIVSKKKRKTTPKAILPCEFDGCGKIFSSRQYLNHHMKYQHFHQRTFTCSHTPCGKSFNFKKHLKEHEKLHSNQRDFICEFCARAFRTNSHLLIHRRIHTGEKPIQCEVCGFTCRQKASLNWHMKKHNSESSYHYQFPCEVCGWRFEKSYNLTAHHRKNLCGLYSALSQDGKLVVEDIPLVVWGSALAKWVGLYPACLALSGGIIGWGHSVS